MRLVVTRDQGSFFADPLSFELLDAHGDDSTDSDGNLHKITPGLSKVFSVIDTVLREIRPGVPLTRLGLGIKRLFGPDLRAMSA
jgi:hypothetical protein